MSNQKQLPAAGTYLARRPQLGVLYEKEETGSLCLALPVQLLSSPIAWSGKTTITLAKGDGTLQERNIDTMKKVFGWDGVDFDALINAPIPEDPNAPEFEVVCEQEVYQPTNGEARDVLRVVFVNAIGDSGSKMPEPADLKSVATKWGAKFKAIAGSAKPAAKPAASKSAKPAAKPAPAQQELPTTAAPASKPAASGPPGRKATPPPAAKSPRTSSQEEAWDKIRAAVAADTSDEDLGGKFWEAADKVAPGANYQLSPEQWGAVLTEFGI